MARDWQDLTAITRDERFTVERVRLVERDIAVEGSFELPPLAMLSAEDQVFVASFIRCHGSIKQMEQLFGVSYPTIKNRLNRIGEQLGFVDVTPPREAGDILTELDSGAISVEQALQMLRK